MGVLRISNVALFGATVYALAYPGPRPTERAVIPLNAKSPKPTFAPVLRELVRRQDDSFGEDELTTAWVAPDNTCGFVSGRAGAVYACISTTNTCVLITSTNGAPGMAGCCNDVACGFHLACYDYADISSSSLCDGGCMVDTFTAKCTSASFPYCNTIVFPGGATDYFCNSDPISTAQRAETSYSNQQDPPSFSPLVLSDDPSTSPIVSVPSTTVDSSSTDPSISSPTSTTTDDPRVGPGNTGGADESNSGGSSTPVGAIVGGVVGGVAAIGLVILGVVLLRRRRASTPPPVVGGDQQQANNMPPPPPPNGGGDGMSPQHNPAGFFAPPPPEKFAGGGGGPPPMTQTYNTTPPPFQSNSPPPPFSQLSSPQQPQGAFAGTQQTTPTMGYNNIDGNSQPISPDSAYNPYNNGASPPPPPHNGHLSQQSFNGYNPQQQQFVQPQHTGMSNLSQQSQPQGMGMGVPPPQHPQGPVYEAGGNVIGGPQDLNPNHRGQMHELQS